jgi:hypothetical protein
MQMTIRVKVIVRTISHKRLQMLIPILILCQKDHKTGFGEMFTVTSTQIYPGLRLHLDICSIAKFQPLEVPTLPTLAKYLIELPLNLCYLNLHTLLDTNKLFHMQRQLMMELICIASTQVLMEIFLPGITSL